ncbi:MAG: UbiD family decarboxylase, partial [Candidatus Eremiobacteraeota bacterium]|nr:UbiD family decarboxylase [Candidatus Eremiobacteraeota bacterium]
MPFESLGAFVQALRKAGELQVIGAPVDPRLEISEITDRVVKAGGPALLFTNVRDSRFPVLTNQFGSARRMAMALDATDLHDVEQRVRSLIDIAPPGGSLAAKFWGAVRLTRFASAIPKTARTGTAQDVVLPEPDLRILPVLTTWPLDAGPFITLPIVITKDPNGGRLNAGIYRMQVYNERETAMHWQRHKHGRAHADAWGECVPVAVAIGTDPVLTYAATAPLPPLLDEFAFAGLLRGKPVELVAAKTVDLPVPADAEFVLEGFVDNEDL